MTQERDVLEVDVLYVGGGIASLSSALQLTKLMATQQTATQQTQPAANQLGDLTIAVIDKGFAPGAHSLSGAVMNPRPLQELVPNFVEQGAPLEGEVRKESLYLLTKTGKLRAPFVPPPLNNRGNYVVSLSRLNRWLADLVEKSGVDLFWGFPAVEVLYDGEQVIGVRTGDKGLDTNGDKKPNYEPGTDIHAKVTVFGEGSRGNLTKHLIADLGLDKGKNPPAFEVGLKEVWELPEPRLQPGEVIHTLGYPLRSDIFGGGFVYGMKENLAAVGQLISLDYADPFLDPHAEFQRLKLHPLLSALLQGGKLVQYGAKTVPVGGLFSIPQLAFPGGLLIGDGANLFNSQKIKGIDLAMRSGMAAAQAVFDALLNNDFSAARLAGYENALRTSPEFQELRRVRNFHQAMKRGLYRGLASAALQYAGRGRILRDRLPSAPDHTYMKTVEGNPLGGAAGPSTISSTRATRETRPIVYDGKLTFDKETELYYSGTSHEETQPPHLKIKDLALCYGPCRERYQNPCQRFCPAQVYEFTVDEVTGAQSLQVNFSNCLHCKTCDIKDPFANIEWVPPEGEGGPKYTVM